MSKKEFIKYVKSTIGDARDFSEIRKRIIDAGFKQINQGAYKVVFKTSIAPSFVVKVYKESDYWETDSPSASKLPKEIRKHVLRPIYWCKRFIIQPCVKMMKSLDGMCFAKIGELMGFENHFRFDIHSNNVGWYHGRYVIIDYLV